MDRNSAILKFPGGRSAIAICAALSLVGALCGVARAEGAAAKAAPGESVGGTTVEIQGRKIDPGKHCLYMNLATVPVNTAEGLLTIKAGINGNATLMILDTGTLHSLLTKYEAEKLGLKLEHARQVVKDENGDAQATYAAFINDVSLDQFFWHRVTLGVVGQIPDSYDAQAGADILLNGLNKDIEFALANKEMRVFVPSDCSNEFLAYWDEHALVVPVTDLSPSDPRQVVTVRLNGHDMIALIDSGAAHSVINLEAAARLGITPKSPGVTEWKHADKLGKVHGATWLAQFDSFSIGDEAIKNTKIAIADLWGPTPAEAPFKAALRLKSLEPPGAPGVAVQSGMSRIGQVKSGISETEHPDMLLGADFLKAHRVLLAMSQRRLYFTYVGGKVFERDDAPKVTQLVAPGDSVAAAAAH